MSFYSCCASPTSSHFLLQISYDEKYTNPVCTKCSEVCVNCPNLALYLYELWVIDLLFCTNSNGGGLSQQQKIIWSVDFSTCSLRYLFTLNQVLSGEIVLLLRFLPKYTHVMWIVAVLKIECCQVTWSLKNVLKSFKMF